MVTHSGFAFLSAEPMMESRSIPSDESSSGAGIFGRLGDKYSVFLADVTVSLRDRQESVRRA